MSTDDTTPWLARFGHRMAERAQAFIPDPFVIALLLAGFSLVVGVLRSERSVLELSQAFAEGSLHTGLLAFAFKMALILVTGHALATTPLVRRYVDWLSALPQTSAQAAASTAVVAMGLGWLNWGLGLVGGAFFAREVGRAFARRHAPLNYPVVGAAGYLGLLVWHGGLSGSAPLKVAVASSFSDAIPITQTVLSSRNLVLTVVVMVAMAVLFFQLGKGGATDEVHPALAREVDADHDRDVDAARRNAHPGFAGFIEARPELSLVLTLPLLVFLGVSVVHKGAGAINLNFVILLFFALGIGLSKSPLAYSRAFGEGAKGAAGILLQFPIYFGILAVTKESGLLTDLANALAALTEPLSSVLSPARVAPALTLMSASVLNVLVPSGGGQWALQAPILLETCTQLQLPKAPMVMAFSYGDQLTNMMQPFWALPLLSITGLKARDVMGYTLLAMGVAFPLYLLAVMV